MARAVPELIRRIRSFNKGRDPHLLARKFATMRTDAFSFYRGTCHLFYEDLPKRLSVSRAPLAWISGDLHPENLGSYRGRDGVVYFDVNDFDEASLAPCSWDVLRCMTGILVGSSGLGILDDDAHDLSRRYLYAYRACLADGVAQSISAAESTGMVHDLLEGVRLRAKDELVMRRTEGKRRRRSIVLDGAHAAKLRPAEKEAATRIFDAWNDSRKPSNRCELIDIAERFAGTGSMGVPRYVALARRKGSLRLLDVKLEPASSLRPYLTARQPSWDSEAQRAVSTEVLAQAHAPALWSVRDGHRSFVIKELQPTADRVRWETWHGKLERLEHLMSVMGQATAWSHLRGAHTKGSAPIKDLTAYARDGRWAHDAWDYSRAYAKTVERDCAQFRAAYDGGILRERAD